jgi:hypothetical protein
MTINSLLIKNARTLLEDEPLVPNSVKPPNLNMVENKYDWGQIYDQTHRRLSNDEVMMYRNLCEAYSDMSAYFMCKKFFTKNEVSHLKGQREYFNVVKNYFYSPNSEWDAPTFLKLQIQQMEDNLVRYFAQFTESNEAFEGGN